MPLTIGDLGTLAIAFVIIAVIIGVGATILTQVQANQCVGGSAGWNSTASVCGLAGSSYNTSTVASNITGDALSGQEDLGDWLPTIATIMGAAAVLGVIYYFRA